MAKRLPPRPHRDLVVITRARTAVWACFASFVGVGLLYRSTPEMVTSFGFLVAALVLWFTTTSQLAVLAFLGYGLLAAACASRVLSVWFTHMHWHDSLIRVAVWSMLTWLAVERSRISLHTVRTLEIR